MSRPRFGVFGLAVMGQNLARNIASHGVPVALYNRTPTRTQRLMEEHGAEGDFSPAYDVASFVASIERPRPILLMVKAGPPVDATAQRRLARRPRLALARRRPAHGLRRDRPAREARLLGADLGCRLNLRGA